MKIRYLWRSILNVALPAACLSCRKDIPIRRRKPLCRSCEDTIKPSGGFHWIEGVENVYAPYEFTGPLRELIHTFKYRGQDGLAAWLVDLWRKETSVPIEEWDALVPVPMNFWKESARGFNPSLLFAKELNRRWKIPIAANGLRCRAGKKSQTHLNRIGRWANAHDNFHPGRDIGDLKNKTVLLVDDVMTTGATLRACAKCLKNQGVFRVSAAVLAVDPLESGS